MNKKPVKREPATLPTALNAYNKPTEAPAFSELLV